MGGAFTHTGLLRTQGADAGAVHGLYILAAFAAEEFLHRLSGVIVTGCITPVDGGLDGPIRVEGAVERHYLPLLVGEHACGERGGGANVGPKRLSI